LEGETAEPFDTNTEQSSIGGARLWRKKTKSTEIGLADEKKRRVARFKKQKKK